MEQKVNYNNAEILSKTKDSVITGWKYIEFYGYVYRTKGFWFWKYETTIEKLVYSTEWVDKHYTIYNKKDFQYSINKALELMEEWYKDHEESAQKIVMEIKTDKSFLI